MLPDRTVAAPRGRESVNEEALSYEGNHPVSLLIVGGVGPRASIELHTKVLKNTVTDGRDQSYLNVHHLSYSSMVCDRTDFLLNGGDHVG